MTRDEILHIANRRGKSCYDLILEVYKEIDKELESRTCENCKYGLQFNYETDYGMCEKGYGWYWNSRMEITKDFGCVKFERKEDE